MTEFEDFYTVGDDLGITEVPLVKPNGEESEHKLTLRSTLSEEFRIAEIKAKRNNIHIAKIEDTVEQAKALIKADAELLAELIVDWTFEADCTHAAKTEFLLKAPQVAKAIDLYCAKPANFFGKRSQSSLIGLEQK